ncbi:Aste57867_1858 [Aphanomyces stellatus]|uniref:Aste57867_1858 protein n=1 Tax=Aphanomyces stellatus TaxID=120398 RepID=A0A485K8T7_9STRA|nr:hypothetical protein As57867_001856 [Aphanomyces stellatus]VFT79065.1 Aste57867_1858 [Aphanomyces stellatus]
MSLWERMTTIEHIELLKSASDNQDLRAAVTSHALFIGQMESLMRKKQRLIPAAMEPWEAFVLPRDASVRVRAMHLILDREYNRTQSVAVLKPQLCGDIHFEVVERVTLAASHRAVSASAWRVVSGDGASTDASFEQSFETIDARTMYIHATNRGQSPTREVVIARSVLGDPMWPTHNGDLIEDVTSWTEITSIPGHEDAACAPQETNEIDDVTALLQLASMAQHPDVHRSISPHAMAQHLASPAAPRIVALGNLHNFLARSKMIEEPFKRAINNAV